MKRIIVLVIAIAVAVPASVLATEPFAKLTTTTSTVRFLRGVRSVGMGATGVADPTAPGNVHMNPANAVGMNGASIFYQHDRIQDDVSADDVGVVYSPRGDGDGWRWGAALRGQRMRFELDDIRTIFTPEGIGQGRDLDNYYTTGTLAAARVRGSLVLAAGISARYWSLEGISSDLSGWAYDVGARVRWSFAGEHDDAVTIRGGVAVLDLDTGPDSDVYVVTVENQLRYGAALDLRSNGTIDNPFSRRDSPLVTATIGVEAVDQGDAFTDNGLGVGAEVGFVDLIYLRAGHTRDIVGYGDGATWGAGLAAAWNALRVRFDVARYPFGSWIFERDNTAFSVAVDYLP